MKRLSCLTIIGLFAVAGLCRADDGRDNANPLGALSLAQLDATRERPLFSPSRHPPAVSPPLAPVAVRDTPPPPPSPPVIVLLGVVTTADGPRAIIKPTPSDKARSIQIGDDIAGWKTAEIEPKRVVLVHDMQSSDVAMFNPKAMRSPVIVARAKPKPSKRQ